MPVDPSPAARMVVPMQHTRKLAFAAGALLTIFALMAIRVMAGLP